MPAQKLLNSKVETHKKALLINQCYDARTMALSK